MRYSFIYGHSRRPGNYKIITPAPPPPSDILIDAGWVKVGLTGMTSQVRHRLIDERHHYVTNSR